MTDPAVPSTPVARKRPAFFLSDDEDSPRSTPRRSLAVAPGSAIRARDLPTGLGSALKRPRMNGDAAAEDQAPASPSSAPSPWTSFGGRDRVRPANDTARRLFGDLLDDNDLVLPPVTAPAAATSAPPPIPSAARDAFDTPVDDTQALGMLHPFHGEDTFFDFDDGDGLDLDLEAQLAMEAEMALEQETQAQITGAIPDDSVLSDWDQDDAFAIPPAGQGSVPRNESDANGFQLHLAPDTLAAEPPGWLLASSPLRAPVARAPGLFDIGDYDLDLAPASSQSDPAGRVPSWARVANYRSPPTDGGFVQATLDDGTYLFFPNRTPNPNDVNPRCATMQLLSSDIYEMINEITEQEARDLTRIEPMAVDSAAPRRKSKRVETSLWVDRYRPSRYKDLVGDETVARDVLAWVRAWDHCVFGKKLPPKKPDPPPPQQFGSGPASGPASAAKGGKALFSKLSNDEYNSGSAIDERDPLHRPFKKLLLLTGPPGLGKTTLASVVARQAGYDLVEINASDDRTQRSVQDRLTNALDAKSLTKGTVSSQPKLVVIDEIDGAAAHSDASFIKTLVQMVEAANRHGAKSNSSATDVDVAAGKPKRGGGGKNAAAKNLGALLRRPIICICNDLYAPVLRPLRQVAKVVHMRKPASTIPLVRRLAAICDLENVKVDQKTLHWIAEHTDSDLRACLNTLQFAKARSASNTGGGGSGSGNNTRAPVIISKDALVATHVGTKDQSQSLFGIWDAMFSARAADALARHAGTPTAPLASLVRAIETNGEYDRVATGCHEYYLRVRTHELDRYASASATLVEFDTILHHGMRMQAPLVSGAAQEYAPYVLAAMHTHFRGGMLAATSAGILGGGKGGRAEYPRADYEAFLRQRAARGVAAAVAHAASPALVAAWAASVRRTVLDVVSPLARIVTPPNLRHANPVLMPPAERARLDGVVAVLAALNVRLVPETVDGIRTFRLEPPIDLLCDMAITRGKLKSLLPASFPVRQLIAHEMDAKAIRRAVEGDIQQRIQKQQNKVDVDFFGRPIEPKISSTPGGTMHVEARNTPRALPKIRFQFNEGYSNAVRKPVVFKDLM
ncbi:hypothetical protein AMAG_03993 [Allomyces macrogynus ATCC 38327]|uniref:AAA+ ATPase domain-containing protein n=1 Tax=Allomyces macrogynus (strain ATCC 38327) TaxID=578462 RepID=A0A0L0S7L9_ALLM3|nr:hypothetical protein AMAG_03993 [Allomyces macrogynus ATCC 38327]|eukprot:KNE58420.1 hypothetical protein AMAG_03993 [Allomyces macrogynus ATCC 38327]